MTTREVDGYLVDEDGEVVGLANVAARAPEGPLTGNSETVREEIEGILERRAKAKAKIASISADFDTLIAGLQERKEKLVKEQERRIGYLDYAFGPMMETYLKENRGDSKSVVLKWGTLGTRKSTKLVIAEEEKCISWCEEHAPNAVKYERSILKKEVPDSCPYAERVTEERFYVEN